jgi:CubicO group peptidase (beta-lactamase class C family)
LKRGHRIPAGRGLWLAAACCAVLVAAAGAPAAVAGTACRVPGAGSEWKRVAPGKLGLDPAALSDAVAFAAAGSSNAAAVYRHGCLAATDPNAAVTRGRTYESWSTAKSVVSLAAGRAMTLGLLSPDDRVGALVPEADRAHGKLTLRQLLEMTSGLHWNFFRDYNIKGNEDRIRDALTLPFDHRPGTYFEYAQGTIALVAEMVGRSARTDFQDFLQSQLFGPIGIRAGSWRWGRERFGHTLGFMGLQLRPRDYARIGQLMLQRGAWRGRRVLDADYVELATSSSPNNPAYGWLWWVNSGRRYIGPTIEGRAAYSGRLVESAPPDMFSAIGLADQLVMVIPSLDMVITRSGGGASTGTGGQSATGSPAFRHELVRRVMAAVEDQRVRGPGPYRAPAPLVPRDPRYGIGHSATEAEHLAAAAQTPPLPPAGPAVARAVQIGGAALHAQPIELRAGGDGHARVTLSCPRVSARACHGTLTLRRNGKRVGKPVRYRIARGATLRIRLPRAAPGRAGLEVANLAEAGPTVSEARVVVKSRGR